MKRHTGYKLLYWRKFDINNKQKLKFSIETYNSIIKDYGKIKNYIASMIHKDFDYSCLAIIEEV